MTPDELKRLRALVERYDFLAILTVLLGLVFAPAGIAGMSGDSSLSKPLAIMMATFLLWGFPATIIVWRLLIFVGRGAVGVNRAVVRARGRSPHASNTDLRETND